MVLVVGLESVEVGEHRVSRWLFAVSMLVVVPFKLCLAWLQVAVRLVSAQYNQTVSKQSPTRTVDASRGAISHNSSYLPITFESSVACNVVDHFLFK